MIALVPAGSVQAATYKKGSTGTSVQYLQQNLTFLGFPTQGADGRFGNNTRKAVLLFQESIDFPQTGTVDEELYTLIKGIVADIQKYLQYKGYYSGAIDGLSGLETEKALKKLQKEKGKIQTGCIDLFILTEILDDTASKVEMKNLREWIARLNKTYGNTLESEYYKKYGKEYLQLFYEYPEVLDYFDEYIDYENSHAYITHKDTDKEQDEAIVWEAVANGVPFFIDYLYGTFGVTEDQVDTVIYSTVLSLVKKMYYKDNAIISVANEVENAANTFEDIFSYADVSSKAVLIDRLMKLHPELTRKTVVKIVDTISEEWENVPIYLKGTTTVVECIVTVLELYSVSDAYLKQLKQSVHQPSVLYSSLCYLEEIREQSEEEFITKYLISELSAVLVEALLDIRTGGKYEEIVGTLRVLSEIFVKATVDEKLNANMMKLYCMSLKNTLIEMRKDFVENADLYIESEMNQKIQNYETAYNFYLSSLETYYESVLEMTSKWPWDTTKEIIQSNIEFLTKNYSYDLYVQMCLVETEKYEEVYETYEAYVQHKIDELLMKLGVKEGGKAVYFTADGKSCTSKWVSGHGEYGCNCCLSQILKPNPEGWFEKTFGRVDPENLPDHDVTATRRSSGGQSCFGFANFAMWYVFQTADKADVQAERVAEGAFNKKFLENNVKPGDVLRWISKDNPNSRHSVLVYAVRDDGLEVVDSNSTFNGQTNCAINKWVMTYTGKFKNGNVYVNRVKYFDESLLNTTEVHTTTDASILNNDKYQVIKSEEKTEYGYCEKETCTETNSVKDGWTLVGEATEGSVLVDWTEQVLTAGEGEDVVTRQTEKEIEKAVYQYSNYYWYTTAGVTNLSSRDWAEKYGRSYNKTVTKAWDYSGLTKSNYKYNVLYSKEYDTPLEKITAPGGTPYVDETGFQWWQEDKKTVTTTVSVTEYRKLVNITSYQFYRWTEAKGWRTDNPYVESDTCKPVTRKVTTYYYIEQ